MSDAERTAAGDPRADADGEHAVARFEPGWLEQAKAAGDDGALIALTWPGQRPDTFEAGSGAWGRFGECVSGLQELAHPDRRRRVVLTHELRRDGVPELGDLVRWLDDTAPAALGLRVSLAPGVEWTADVLRPAWANAVTHARGRGVGLEAVGPWPEGVPLDDAPGLKPLHPDVDAPRFPEDLQLAHVEEHGSLASATAHAVKTCGGFERFVRPERVDIEVELLRELVALNPYDQERFARELPPGRDRPIVCVDLTEVPGHPDVVRTVVEECRALDCDVFLTGAPGAAALAESLAPEGGVPFKAHGTFGPNDLDQHIAVSLLTDVLAEGVWGDAPRDVGGVDLWLFDALDGQAVLACGAPLVDDIAALGAVERAEDGPGFVATALPGDSAERYGSAFVGAARAPAPRPELDASAARPRPVRRPRLRSKPLTILGVACTTLQNHAAALLKDGELVASVQEERFRRKKQAGWHPPGRPGVTVVSDARLPLRTAWPKRSVQYVLDAAGVRLEDVDIIAYNGVPERFFPTYSLRLPERPPEIVRFGRTWFIPHHLTHAASAFYVSGFGDDTFTFTVDGRGERETAAFFDVQGGRLRRVFDVRCGEDSLIGGVYEYITTILGFGHYGQGSTMGLASMGPPTEDLSPFLSAESRDRFEIHDRGIFETFGHLSRHRDGPLTDRHIGLAAGVQVALERTVEALVRDGLAGRTPKQLCLAGGVALNCAMNQKLREGLGVEQIFVQPGAHDSGTALGAALEAHVDLTGERPSTVMRHAYWGPEYSEAEIRAALDRYGVPYRQVSDMPREVGDRVADGRVVCWFQGRMELGPRALGARSILADPRRADMQARLNTLKRRQWWRPFGPSILAGHEADWFDHPMHTPFMLFTLPVRADKQERIPAVCHLDGTTRPQSVEADVNPRYHAAISRFFERTGVPMVVNTSFNTAFEPIVCSPDDAVASFLDLGADHLAIGDFLVDQADVPRLHPVAAGGA